MHRHRMAIKACYFISILLSGADDSLIHKISSGEAQTVLCRPSREGPTAFSPLHSVFGDRELSGTTPLTDSDSMDDL